VQLSGLLLFSGGASAATAEPLWQNVDAGMTVAQLRSVYPEGGAVSYGKDEILLRDFRMTPDCPADVHILLRAGVVRGVTIQGPGTFNRRCSDTVLDGLSAKYGEALHVEDTARIVYRWTRPNETVEFSRLSPNDLANLFQSWRVTYQPAPKLPL
jgi:hypothetical protein